MKFFLSGCLALSSLATEVYAAPGSGLWARGQCGNLLDQLAYDVVEILHATPFCTSWLGVTTYTQYISIPTTSTASALATTTVTSSSGVVTTTTTTLPIQVLSTTTVEAATSTSVVLSSTVTTAFSTVVSHTTVDASTSYSYSLYLDPNAKKVKRDHAKRDAAPVKHQEKRNTAPIKPPKPAQLKDLADDVISSACSCAVTTPSTTSTVYVPTTTTITSTSTSFVTYTYVASTEVYETISTIVSVVDVFYTPVTVVDSVIVSTVTQVTTTTSTSVIPTTTIVQVADPYVQLDNFNGCTFTGTASISKLNYAATGQEDALNQCYPLCVQVGIRGGNGGCVAIEIQQSTPTSLFNCYVTDQPNSYSNNFDCPAEPENQYPQLLQYLIY